jgi:predicted ester cyclase
MTKVLNMAGEAGDRRWAIFERFIAQGLVKGQFPILDEVEMEQLTDHQDYGPGYPPGRNGVRALTSALLQAFPDMQSDIEEIVFAADESWARIRSYGTFNGPYLGIPPNGSPISIYVVESVRWTDDDRITEHWGVADRFNLLVQMGMIAPQYVPVWSPQVAGPLWNDWARVNAPELALPDVAKP